MAADGSGGGYGVRRVCWLCSRFKENAQLAVVHTGVLTRREKRVIMDVQVVHQLCRRACNFLGRRRGGLGW